MAGVTTIISTTVYADSNADGLQDNGEAGLAGVTVEILDAATGAVLVQDTTDSTGNVQFIGAVGPGTYEIAVLSPAGDIISQSTNILSNFDLLPNIEQTGTLGVYTPASLSGTIFFDTNTDGLLEAGEAGASGVTVQLLDASGNPIANETAVTDANGNYSFTGLAAGTYSVEMVAPAGETITPGGSFTPSTGVTLGTYTLTPGANDTGVNGGLTSGLGGGGTGTGTSGGTATFTTTVYLDANGDGTQDNGELGLANVAVTLENGSGVVQATGTTGSNGVITFGTLAPGSYQVLVATPGGDITTQVVNVGAVNTLAAGDTANAIEGVYLPATFTTHVYTDANGNSTQDGGDSNLANVKVTLENAAGVVQSTATTDANGNVTFGGLAPGGYQVVIGTPAGDVTTQITNVGAVNVLSSGGTANAIEGVYVPATFNTHVYLDVNGNSTQDTGDANLAGVKVTLLTGTGAPTGKTATTDASGNVSFTNLVPGSYEVTVLTPAGDTVTQLTNVGTSNTLAPGGTALAIEGVKPPASSTGISVLKLPASVAITTCQTATYTYLVSNTGTTPLGNITVVDNHGTAASPDNVKAVAVLSGGYNIGDVNHDGLLQSGETWQYTASMTETGGAGSGVCSLTHKLSNCNITSGKTAWLSTCFKPTSTSDGATYAFKGVKVCITNTGGQPINETCGDSYVKFSKGCTSPTTTWDDSQKAWCTTLPANQNCGNVFLSGIPVQVPSGCNLSNSTVTWTIGSSANNCGSSNVSWQGSACGYNNFDQNGCYGSSDNNQIGVQPCDNAASSGCGSWGNWGSWGGGCGSWGSGWGNSSQGCAGTPSNQNTWGNCSSGSSNGQSSGSCTLPQGQLGSTSAVDIVTATGTPMTAAPSCSVTQHLSNCGLDSGKTAWLSSCFKPSSTADGATYTFKGVQVCITGTGGSPISKDCGNSYVTFSKSCTTANTVWDTSKGAWVTTLPAGQTCGNVFLTGVPVQVPSGCNLSNATVTWNTQSASNNCGATSLQWQTSCSSYGSFNKGGYDASSDYNQIGVKSCDGSSGGSNWQTCAGTPTVQNTWGNCGSSQSSGSCALVAGTAISATDIKEIQVLACNSPITVNGTTPAGVLTSLYGNATKLEFSYNPSSSVSVKSLQAGLGTVTGNTPSASAFILMTNNSNAASAGAQIFFEGNVQTGEKIYADATTNIITMTAQPAASNHFSTTPGADLYAHVYASQQAFLAGNAPVQEIAYNVSGSQAMNFGDQIGSLTVIGYVGTTGGHLVS